jgi:hypothetical protein
MSKKKKRFVGEVIVPELVIGTKKPKAYKLGSKFITYSEAVYNSLIKHNKIK